MASSEELEVIIIIEQYSLSQGGIKIIYLDTSATTAIYPEALQTYSDVVKRIMGNPSSLHNLGTTASRLLAASRKQIADLLNVQASEVYFTSGGTESDNWILKGLAWEKAKFGRHIIVSDVEHPAVKNTAKWLATQGFDVEFAPVDKRGFVKVDTLKQMIREDTIIVSIMAVNNEIGAIQPLKEIAELLTAYPTISFHVDAVQAIGKLPVEDWLLDRVDFVSLSAHKFHGPRGVGIAVIKSGKRLTPLLHGGGQENGRRSTTENLAGIAASARALRITLDDFAAKRERVLAMKQAMYDELKKHEQVLMFSEMDDFIPNILTWGIKGIRGEVVVHAFEEHEIYISTTSACSSKNGAAASTLVAMKVKPELSTSAVRVSMDYTNTMAEVEQFLTIFRLVLEQLTRNKA